MLHVIAISKQDADWRARVPRVRLHESPRASFEWAQINQHHDCVPGVNLAPSRRVQPEAVKTRPSATKRQGQHPRSPTRSLAKGAVQRAELFGTRSTRRTLYTIGHSTRSAGELVHILRAFGVTRLVDIRSIPRSRTNPQFNLDVLPATLHSADIAYVHLASLGGRRTKSQRVDEGANAGWERRPFHNYADYAETAPFRKGLRELLEMASRETCAIMCAEAVWWRCHRRIVADHVLAGLEEHTWCQGALAPATAPPGQRRPREQSGRRSWPHHENRARSRARNLLRDAAEGFRLAHDACRLGATEDLASRMDVQAGDAIGQLAGRGIEDLRRRMDRGCPKVNQIPRLDFEKPKRVDDLELRPTSPGLFRRSGDRMERRIRQVARSEHPSSRYGRARHEHATARVAEHPFDYAAECTGQAGPTLTADDDDVRSPRLRPPDDCFVVKHVLDENLHAV